MVKNNSEESVTAGYPRIEKLVESEKFDEVNKSFAKAYEELEGIAKAKKGLGKAKAAQKAMKAYQLTSELFKELLKVKYQMMDAMEQKSQK